MVKIMQRHEEKNYSRREEKASAFFHGAGVLFLLAAAPLFLRQAGSKGAAAIAAISFYLFSFGVMFLISTLYHLAAAGETKRKLQILDHSMIYLLILGSYAPLIFIAFRTTGSYIIAGVLLLLTFAGVTGRHFFGRKFKIFELTIYLLMGWCCAFIFPTMLAKLSSFALQMLFYGGLAYSAGTVFYLIRREFCHAVWHIFVLAGAVLQAIAVYQTVR